MLILEIISYLVVINIGVLAVKAIIVVGMVIVITSAQFVNHFVLLALDRRKRIFCGRFCILNRTMLVNVFRPVRWRCRPTFAVSVPALTDSDTAKEEQDNPKRNADKSDALQPID